MPSVSKRKIWTNPLVLPARLSGAAAGNCAHHYIGNLEKFVVYCSCKQIISGRAPGHCPEGTGNGSNCYNFPYHSYPLAHFSYHSYPHFQTIPIPIFQTVPSTLIFYAIPTPFLPSFFIPFLYLFFLPSQIFHQPQFLRQYVNVSRPCPPSQNLNYSSNSVNLSTSSRAAPEVLYVAVNSLIGVSHCNVSPARR